MILEEANSMLSVHCKERITQMANEYSEAWFEFFMKNKDPNETKLEADFIMRNIPVTSYKSVLDICCGQGRHSRILAENGYRVTGIDMDINSLDYANKNTCNGSAFYVHDMRDMRSLNKKFDAIISMWHSFGYFEDEVNRDIIKQISELLYNDGRFIIDIYNKAYYENNLGTSRYMKQGIEIVSTTERFKDRYNVRLTYGHDEKKTEEFSWILYTKDEMINICDGFGLTFRLGCTWGDENQPITNDSVRMQLVFEKR